MTDAPGLEEFTVSLPISPAQADVIGMPAEWFARAVRTLGRHAAALSAVRGEPVAWRYSPDNGESWLLRYDNLATPSNGVWIKQALYAIPHIGGDDDRD